MRLYSAFGKLENPVAYFKRRRTVSYYKNSFISEAEYTRMYKEILDKLKSDGALSGFVEDLKEHDKVLLLCYEGKYKFCHRHILAEYLNKHYALDITEL